MPVLTHLGSLLLGNPCWVSHGRSHWRQDRKIEDYDDWRRVGYLRSCLAMLFSKYCVVSTEVSFASLNFLKCSFCRMLCARFINGIGTGHLNAIVPVWSAEVATHTSRGRVHRFIQPTRVRFLNPV